MTGERKYGIGFAGALLLLAPAMAAAQDPLPSPPKQEIVTIRTVAGVELKGKSSIDLFGFMQKCSSKQGHTESSVQLTLPFEIEGGPNDPIERVTTLLRKIVEQGEVVAVEPSSEPGKILTFAWSSHRGAFKGVIESLAVKYTLFMPDGTPSRATADLKLRQAGSPLNKGEASEGGKPGTKKQPDCSPQR